MANMSYCRFNNTSIDLSDCLETLDDLEDNDFVDEYGSPLSKSELSSARFMLKNFAQFLYDKGIIDDYEEDRVDEYMDKFELREDEYGDDVR